MTEVLEGLRVVDLSRRYPGAYAAMYLADFGADVIKVDPHDTKLAGQTADTDSEEFAGFFPHDRNKRSVTIDLPKEEGQQILHRMIPCADVFFECFRPGKLKKLNCDYETLSKINPRLIYCSATGFGQDGPFADRPGNDMNDSWQGQDTRNADGNAHKRRSGRVCLRPRRE